jgi:transposase-like protein
VAETRLPVLYAKRRRWTIANAQTVVTALKASGLSVAAFAERERLDPQRVYFWKRRLEKGLSKPAVPAFIEVRRHPPEVRHVEIALPSGRIVRVAESIATVTIAKPYRVPCEH